MEQLSQIESFLSLHKQRMKAKKSGTVVHRLGQEHVSGIAGLLHPAVQEALHEFLFQPAMELRKRPSHSFRSQLVDLGFLLAGGLQPNSQDRHNLDFCANSIEYLHLGSLIIDDIQDGSDVRRSGQALHRMLGTPHALGVGNWLYFYSLRILSNLELNEDQLNALYDVYAETVEIAHYGQILDLCVKIDRVPYSQIEALSQECMRYKTGSIVMLALVLGALVGGADAVRLNAVEQLGYALGIYLQRMNDIGNCAGSFDLEKKWEDLIQWKPSYIWAFAAREYGMDALQQLMQAVRELPDESAWQAWMSTRNLCDDAKAQAEREMDQAFRDFKNATHMSWSDLHPLAQLKERIQKAYG